MPPKLAALFTILLIFYLFWIDRKNNEGFSKAIWIPFVWMFFSRSRNISEWLNLGTPDLSASATTILEGNPLNRNVYLFLIIAGIVILLKRKIDWHTLFIKNSWIWLYLAFGALSFVWSDYPYVSFKRWIKALGVVVMVLIVVSESRPYIAIGVLLKRLAFILLPLSVLFIKYYPELGRGYHMGQPMFTGVSDQKNGLGQICLFAGIYFSWNLFLGRREENVSGQKLHYSIYLIMLPMIAWLLYMANSATSLACLISAIGIFAVGSHPAMVSNPRRILQLGIASVLVFGMLEFAFSIKDTIITLLGRRPDLTTRVPMWEDLLSMVKNPIIGFGYESFWLGDRLQYMVEHWGIDSQAHNGYLEMYLNLGIVGLMFILLWTVSGLRNVNRHLTTDYPAAMLRFCFIVVVVLYNYTEATFFGTNTLWMLFFIGILYIPGQDESSLLYSERKIA